MPPSPPELQQWWLDSGRESLEHLLDRQDLSLSPRDVGFAQSVQRKLRRFDHDEVLQNRLRSDWLAGRSRRAKSSESNPRRRLKEALTTIFRRNEDGGLLIERALEGLAGIDAAEIHRLRLVAATKLALEPAIHCNQKQIFEALQDTAAKRYGQFHMGFRASILVEYLHPSRRKPANTTETMALVNALFPATVNLEDSEDFDPSPYSCGFRDSIRFTLYEHLLVNNPASEEQYQVLQTKLLRWCDILDYEKSRDSLMRYVEESKKLEETCFEILNSVESAVTDLFIVRSGSASALSAREKSQSEFLESPIPWQSSQNQVHDSPKSNFVRPQENPDFQVSHALMSCATGRELLGAQTNLSAFAGDDEPKGAQSQLSLGNFSSSDFDEHPLARELNMTSAEKASLGLLILKAPSPPRS